MSSEIKLHKIELIPQSVPLEYSSGQDISDHVTQEERMASIREIYSRAIDTIMDKVLEELIVADDQVQVAADAAAFTTFLMAIKICAARRLPVNRENLMGAYWPLQKSLKDDVPGMLRRYAEDVAKAEAEEAAAQASK
jgi:hypothetical protein